MMPTEYFLAHIWMIPLFPLAGAALMLLIGRRLPNSAVNVICVGSVFLAMCYAFGAIWQLIARPVSERVVSYTLFDWVPAGIMHTNSGRIIDFHVPWGVLIDPLTCVMLFVVTGVGFLIHVYSTGYMGHEGGYYRFFGYLNLFMFAMLTLITANNLLLLFVGWEGVGLCSYLLIGFYFLRKSASDAGKKAFIVNRIGDAGFILGLFLMLGTLGTIQFTEIGPAIAAGHFAMGDASLTAIALLLFVGATGKSAQLPLYVWLPDAMEGPTPVSALIHAATMVTAGVYMIARTNAVFSMAPKALAVIAVVGCLTSIFAATMGLVQNDIKRVLAYSTVSQLGYMFLACGVGAFTAGVFHLMTHAFFKACLFLGSGSVIHAMSGEQDMRKMGGLWGKIPTTAKTFVVASIAIAGIPPLAGFFSKDSILGHAFEYNKILWAIGFITAGMTAFYMFRLVNMTFFGNSRVDHDVEHHIHESPRAMTVPLMILATLSLVGGWVGWPASLGGSDRFDRFLQPVISHYNPDAIPVDVRLIQPGNGMTPSMRTEGPFPQMGAEQGSELKTEPIEYILMLLSVLVACGGIWLAYRWYIQRPEVPEKIAAASPFLYKLLYNKYYV
ncbi:MAG TPA: NADH-quinone oxidoreductase subunit L, partial [Candidatus Saccharimonadales bacterium]|nr:NADH-quinone oxidoreductase subunit L [Candidatus Saccharimonadales bacterium]